MTMASAIFSQGFWLAGSLVLAPFAFGFLISTSTYRFRPKGAPSREFHAAEIWTSCGLVSRVLFTEASILARKGTRCDGGDGVGRRSEFQEGLETQSFFQRVDVLALQGRQKQN